MVNVVSEGIQQWQNGREVRNHNVLIYLCVDVNGEVKDLRRLFNIIYIMRTRVVIRGFWRPGLMMGFLLWPTISTPVAHTVERIRFSAGLKPSSFRCRLHCHCRLLLSDTMMFAQKSLNTQCLSPVHFLQ